MDKILLFDGGQWIDSQLLYLLPNVVVANSLLDHYPSLISELECVNPSHVVLVDNGAGRADAIGVAVLAEHCHRRAIHLTYLTTKRRQIQEVIQGYSNVLFLCMGIVLSDDLSPLDSISRLLTHRSYSNSISLLYDLLPLIPEMISQSLTGSYSLVNPGVISRDEVVGLYREYIDPDFSYEETTQSDEEENQTSPLLETRLDVPDIRDSIRQLFKRMKAGDSCVDGVCML